MSAECAGLTSWIAPHTLRHSFARHLLEQPIDVPIFQVVLGHARLDTTALYTEVATIIIVKMRSPPTRLTPIWPRCEQLLA